METLKKVAETVVEGVAEKISAKQPDVIRRMNGCPVMDGANKNSLTAGPNGPVLLEDVWLLEKIKQFVREPAPLRNVHPLGTGCYGHFTLTRNMSEYTTSKLLTTLGKKTEIFVRFSGVFAEKGCPDTMRDPRGIAIKWYTEEGNWDLLCINTPVFNCRDAKIGPDAIHAFKREPRYDLYKSDTLWDFVALHPEGLHQVLMVYTDRDGTPASFRMMNGFGVHAFSWINKDGKRVWVKYHLISEQGTKGLNRTEAKLIGGEDPQFLCRDLHESIERGQYPRWKFCVQIMPEEEGLNNPFAFDATKVWKHSDYPLIEIGTIEVNRNPIDYVCEVEQSAFSPANILPGMGFSPDKLLQGRLLIYEDAQHHRIGPNFKMLPINRPIVDATPGYNIGGNMNLMYKDKSPTYLPSSFGGPVPDLQHKLPTMNISGGTVGYHDIPLEGTDEDYYAQCRDFISLLIPADRTHLVDNITASLSKVQLDSIVTKMMDHFRKVDRSFAQEIETLLRTKKNKTAERSEGEVLLEQMERFLRGEIRASP